MKAKLEEVELLAWVGEDELGSGIIGLKQAAVPAGIVPLVVIKQHSDKLVRLLPAMQDQSQEYRKQIFLVKFKFDGVMMATDRPPGEQVADPRDSKT